MKYTDTAVDQVTHAPATGIYRMCGDGSVSYQRFDFNLQAVDSECEAFFLASPSPW